MALDLFFLSPIGQPPASAFSDMCSPDETFPYRDKTRGTGDGGRGTGGGGASEAQVDFRSTSVSTTR